MMYKTFIYEDPTGGGDDAELTLPAWAEAPSSIQVVTNDETIEHFRFFGVKDEEE